MSSYDIYVDIDQKIESMLYDPTYFTPSILYIKRIKRSDASYMYYFGKTTNPNDVFIYAGSGVLWKKLIKKHGRDSIETIWVSEVYTSAADIQKDALRFSLENNIDTNTLWANLTLENGINGGTWHLSLETKTKNLESRTTTLNSLEWKETKGKAKSEKRKKTYSSETWKESVGKNAVSKRKETMNSPDWLETKGKQLKEKRSKASTRFNSAPEYDESRKQKSINMSKTSSALTQRPLVKVMREISKLKNIKLGNNWSRKNYEELYKLIESHCITQECFQLCQQYSYQCELERISGEIKT